jgi:signal transduction histidine kinase
VALALFRIAQEALANAARHGGAKQATVSLERTATSVVLTVADDGKGFDVHAARQNGGLGLVSMEERARFVRGRVAIRSRPGSGTTVDVRIPVQIADDQLVAQAGDAHVARRKSTRFVAES